MCAQREAQQPEAMVWTWACEARRADNARKSAASFPESNARSLNPLCYSDHVWVSAERRPISIGQHPHHRAGTWLLSGQLLAGQLGNVRPGVGVSVDSPPPVRRLRDQYPRATSERRVTSGRSHNLGEFLHDTELLFAIEDANRRKHLDSNMGT